MSNKAQTWAWSQDVKPAAKKFVLIALADNSDDHGICFPSYNTIAKKTALTRRAVINNCNALLEEGIIQKAGRSRGNLSHTSNAYLLPIVDGCIDDHPLSCLFPAPSERGSPPLVNHMHPPSERGSPPSEPYAPLEPSENLHKNLKKKKPLTRYSFCREINRAIKSNDMGDEFSHLAEAEIVNNTGACWDWLEMKFDILPVEGKGIFHMRAWLRKGMSLGKISRPAKASKGEYEEISAEELPAWQQKALADGIFEPAIFKCWIKGLEWNGNGTVYAPTRFIAQTVEKTYMSQICQALHADIKIEVKPSCQ